MSGLISYCCLPFSLCFGVMWGNNFKCHAIGRIGSTGQFYFLSFMGGRFVRDEETMRRWQSTHRRFGSSFFSVNDALDGGAEHVTLTLVYLA